MDLRFPAPGSAAEAEAGATLAPRFDRDGLVTCVVSDASSGEVVMVAHMNAEALRRTIETGEAHYWSRSRRRLWKKGEESGHVQRVVEMRVDCDQDAVWIRVETAGTGANCHTGRKSCFYRTVALGADGGTLAFTGDGPLFDPAAVYSAAKQP
ncbi:MAG TPA: phosphoribosyl-AMP cyclohydrolase [Hyphomicrobiales bacterium]|nr:phosphoribosyl-AMP cyclohydrolase [Hyphomicrobiales bacterium]